MRLENVFGKDLLSEIYSFCEPKLLTFDEAADIIDKKKLETKIKVIIRLGNIINYYAMASGCTDFTMSNLKNIVEKYKIAKSNEIIVTFSPESHIEQESGFKCFAEDDYIEKRNQCSFYISISSMCNLTKNNERFIFFRVSGVSEIIDFEVSKINNAPINFFDIGC
jgi:hypothetical protein